MTSTVSPTDNNESITKASPKPNGRDEKVSQQKDQQPKETPTALIYDKSPKQYAKGIYIGGPGTRLPFWLESLLVWMLAVSCLSVACYHYIRQMFGLFLWKWSSYFPFLLQQKNQQRQLIPLTTHCPREILQVPIQTRFQQFIQLLALSSPPSRPLEEWTDDELVQHIQKDHLARRLASLLIILQQKQQHDDDDNNNNPHLDLLLQRLRRLWPRLIRIPAPPTIDNDASDNDEIFEISVIIPVFKEDGKQLLTKLSRAHNLAWNPQQIEIIIVDAGQCTNLQEVILHNQQEQEQQNHTSTKLALDQNTNGNSPKKLEFGNMTCTQGKGGRGPCLNAGARLAKGRILTFLHADTQLSPNWNVDIIHAFSSSKEENGYDSNNNHDHKKNNSSHVMNTACAFSFAIDTSASGLQGGPFPPGIRAIEYTANLRSHWFHLPYGDQCLSIPRHVFQYLGGFPDQCLMEDYELIRLLRQRIVAVSLMDHGHGYYYSREQLAILPTLAFCSPRRWQTFGALYVTWNNSKMVNLYATGNVTPDDLFRLYYGAPNAPERDHPTLSPWETELQQLLLKGKKSP